MPVKKTIKKNYKPAKLRLINSSRFSLRRMVPFLLLFAIVGTIMLWRSFAADYSLSEIVISEPNYPSYVSGDGKVLERGNVTGFMMYSPFTKPAHKLYFRDNSSGKSTNVGLEMPLVTPYKYVWNKSGDIWIYAVGNASGAYQQYVHVLQYRPDNVQLPTALSLVKHHQLGGNSDSRQGDMIELASGAMAASWHQQGTGGAPQGHTFAYLPVGGASWQLLPLDFMPTNSADQVLVQHPADNSIWSFTNPDAWGAVGAARLVESAGQLKVDWTNGLWNYHDSTIKNDPENPDLSVATDAATGEIVLAYQSDERKWFTDSSGNFKVGSYPVIVRIKPDNTKTATKLPVYVERVSKMALVVRPGEVWLAYHPLDPDTLTFDRTDVSLHRNGQWEAPVRLGANTTAIGVAGISRPEFVLTTSNAQSQHVSFFTFMPVPQPPSDTTTPTAVITEPISGAAVKGTVVIKATASDNVGVTGVELLVDGAATGTADTAAPYEFNFDTTKVADGAHTLTVRAYDAAGNKVTSAPVTVTVQNQILPPADTLAPSVSITSPANNSTISGKTKSVTINASATDNVGVAKMEVYINGTLTNTVMNSTINYTWDTSRLAKGSHTVSVKAYDAKGNVGTAQVVVKK